MEKIFMLLLVFVFSTSTVFAEFDGWKFDCTTDSFTDEKRCSVGAHEFTGSTSNNLKINGAALLIKDNNIKALFYINAERTRLGSRTPIEIRIDRNRPFRFDQDDLNGEASRHLVSEMLTGQTLKFRIDGKVSELPLIGFAKAWRQLVQDAGHDPLMATAQQTGI